VTLTAPPTATHPLARLTAEEITAATEIIRDAGLVEESSKFVYVGLEEPSPPSGPRGSGRWWRGWRWARRSCTCCWSTPRRSAHW
jgi:hypothetical protein